MTCRDLVRTLALDQRILAVAANLDPASIEAVALRGIVRDLLDALEIREPPAAVWLVVRARQELLRARGDALVQMGVTDAIYWESILSDFAFAADIAAALAQGQA